MATNPYFKHFKSQRHQNLLESQIIEVIKRDGWDIKYIPRTVVKADMLFGEDVLSTFEKAAEIEAYIKNVDGYEGQGRFMSKFGIEVRDKITFTISKKRFKQIQDEKIIQESSYNLENDDGLFKLEDITAEGYNLERDYPKEGDLIYFSMVDKVFEITYVNKESFFYQFGALYTFDLECELFEYSAERFDTNHDEIDFYNKFSSDVLNNKIIGEDGEIQLEDGSALINEADAVEDTNPTADNKTIDKEVEGIVDWSEVDPLVNRNKSLKW